MRHTAVIILLLNLTLLLSCSERKPYEEEFYDNAEFFNYIRIIKDNKILSLYEQDGSIKVSMYERSKGGDTLTLKLTDKQILSFNKIIERQLEPGTLIAGKGSKEDYEVRFTINHSVDEITGIYQSDNFNDISPEFSKFAGIIFENKKIKNFLEDESNK
jgi:hypothetical protein